jgi:hypothetical protein
MTNVLWHPAVRWPIVATVWLALGVAAVAAIRLGIVLVWGVLG